MDLLLTSLIGSLLGWVVGYSLVRLDRGKKKQRCPRCRGKAGPQRHRVCQPCQDRINENLRQVKMG
jgi:hypothetical protein